MRSLKIALIFSFWGSAYFKQKENHSSYPRGQSFSLFLINVKKNKNEIYGFCCQTSKTFLEVFIFLGFENFSFKVFISQKPK